MLANDLGGGIETPRTTLPGQRDLETPYAGSGDYNPFPEGTGGGIGGFVPPVAPNPIFVPPSYKPTGTIKIHLISNESVQFTENETNVGIGTSITLTKPSVSFGDQKIYKSVLNGKRPLNYFIVSIQKTFNSDTDIINNASTLLPGLSDVVAPSTAKVVSSTQNAYSPVINYGFSSTTSTNDYIFSEIVSIKEFELDIQTGQYTFSNERQLASTSGFIDLNFRFEEKSLATPSADTNTTIGYQIGFKSNYANELGDKIYLKYDIVDINKNIISSDSISLSTGESDLKNIETAQLKDITINFKIDGELSNEYKYNSIYYINRNALTTIKSVGFANWRQVGQSFSISGNDLQSGIVVDVEFDKDLQPVVKPMVVLDKSQYEIRVKESDDDTIFNLQFTAFNCDYVDVYVSPDKIYRVPYDKGYVQLSFKNDFSSKFGNKELLFVANSTKYGVGDRVKAIISYVSVNDFPDITQIIFPPNVTVPAFSDLNVEWDVTYKSFAASSVDVYLLAKDLTRLPLFSNLTPNGTFKINLSDLANRFQSWNGSDKLTLIFKPYNRASETEHIGNEHEVTTTIQYPSIKLDETIIRKSIYDAFINKLSFTEPEKESKYLTHLLNLGNDEHILISSWEEDNWTLSDKTEDELGNQIVTNEVKSLILKLYSPLPPEVQANQTFWISKLMTNPLVETVVLNEQFEEEHPVIKGPNFNIDIDFVKGTSTDYESLDDLIISASSSTNLIQTYLSASVIEDADLNINYVRTYSVVPESPTTLNAAIQYGVFKGDSYTANFATAYNYKLYSYIQTDFGKVLSNEYAELPTNLISNTSGNTYRINISWPAIRGVDGYIIVNKEDLVIYTTNTTLVDSGVSVWTDNVLPNQNIFNGNYIWENFVHFSSAEERINNFVYKVQLIENYEQLILSASTDYTSGGNASWTGSFASQQEVQRLNAKKSSLIQGFDGFEKFLFTPSTSYSFPNASSATWPFDQIGNRFSSTSQEVIDWYNNVIAYAGAYDNENPNYLVNNIPQYILTNPENENFLLFFSMIGHHFDTIYFYTKALERTRNLGYSSTNGVADRLLYDQLKSMSWDALNLGQDTKLWDYVFGEDSDGNVTQTNPSKKRTSEVWRRIVNNLPYLLKHKGSRRGIHALMACYGIPSSNLSIMEFGGPEVTTDSKSKLLVDDTSYALKFDGVDDMVNIPWQNSQYGRHPDTIEIFVKANKEGGSTTPGYNGIFGLSAAYGFEVYTSGSANGEYGKVYLRNTGNGSNVLETPILPIYNDRFFGICVSRTYIDSTHNKIELSVKQMEGDREIFSSFTSGTFTTSQLFWDATVSYMQIGANADWKMSGSIDEVRLWATPLSRSVFEEHCAYPEMINGNHISSSTTDLLFRLDFEYPKDAGTNAVYPNVAPIIYFSGSLKRNDYEIGGVKTLYTTNAYAPLRATGANFLSITDYPYNFEKINRNCVLEIPDLGASRYSTNKVRFEDQTLVSDLSAKHRSTKKAFDHSPTDSNRVGIFVSPNKELNFDIAKSLGASNLDDYIGDPSDRYKPTYNSLDKLRNYYFGRINNRDIYEYINLIKSYEKVMFDDIKKMLPARVKATTGLLIEPHFLERSKYAYTKPEGQDFYYEGETQHTASIFCQNNQYDALVDANMGEQIFGENEQYETIINADLSENLFGENEQYESIIYANDEINLSGDYKNYETIVNAKYELPTVTSQADVEASNTLLSNTLLQDVGFSVYCQNGSAIWNYYDTSGVLVKERILVNLITEQKTKIFDKYIVVNNGVGDPRGGFETTSSLYTETNLVIQEFTSSAVPTPPSVGGTILSVTPVNGYLPTHYKYVGDLTTGMQNSYYRGSKNTADTTLDGASPIEVFVTNPNTIKVVGRDNNEPIIEVE